MDEGSGWRCPLCGAIAASGAEHIKREHAVGGSADRLGLRRAIRPVRNEGEGRAARQGLPRPVRRPRRQHVGAVPEPPPEPPPRPAPLPLEAAVLRLVCENLDGVDPARLEARLAALQGVESAAIDLYERTVDLYLDRRHATPPHLVTLATERVGLPVVAAELHRAPPGGGRLGPNTLLFVVR